MSPIVVLAASLNQYLDRFKRVDNPRCPACGHPKEMAEHFLLHRPSYVLERWPILNNLGGSLPKLSRLLSSTKLLANFIEASGRFEPGAGTYPVSDT